MLTNLLVPLTILTLGCSATAGEVRDALGCDRSDDSVQLNAEIVQADGNINVRLSFQNQSGLGVRLISIGAGAYWSWKIDPDSIPEPIDSPTGWGGQLVIEHEGVHMKVMWVPDSISEYVSPGDSLVGLGFSLGAGATLPDDLPFQAMFADGTCVWSQLTISNTL